MVLGSAGISRNLMKLGFIITQLFTAFGRRMSWEEDVKIPPGHKKTFKDALHTVSLSIIIRALIPPWAMNSTQYLRDVSGAFHELEVGICGRWAFTC